MFSINSQAEDWQVQRKKPESEDFYKKKRHRKKETRASTHSQWGERRSDQIHLFFQHLVVIFGLQLRNEPCDTTHASQSTDTCVNN